MVQSSAEYSPVEVVALLRLYRREGQRTTREARPCPQPPCQDTRCLNEQVENRFGDNDMCECECVCACFSKGCELPEALRCILFV